MKMDPDNQATLARIFGLGALNLLLHFGRKNDQTLTTTSKDHDLLEPVIEFSSSGFCKSVEGYGDYVVRQLGLPSSSAVSKRLSEVAESYLRGDHSDADNSIEGLFVFISKACSEISDEELEHLNQELVKELDTCMLSYFAFHWHRKEMVEQVQMGDSKLRKVIMSATRKQRFERVMNTLKTKRTFSTLVDQLKAIRHGRRPSLGLDDKTVVVAADCTVRSPVLLMIGGGMGAGKSTVVKEILSSPFWSAVAQDAVVVEADAFKETDVIYRALSSLSHADVSEASQLVHESSTNAASSLLVAALNEGRDVIFDGTLSWEPFVLQTLAMVRDIHRRRYRMGPGYRTNEDGSVLERYWEPVEEDADQNVSTNSGKYTSSSDISDKKTSFSDGSKGSSHVDDDGSKKTSSASGWNAVMQALQEPKPAESQPKEASSRPSLRNGDKEDLGAIASDEAVHKSQGKHEKKPYRIELVGVTCDAQLAVMRGIRRTILTKRSVPIKGQLRSHKLFAQSLEKYCNLVDQVKIYSTSSIGGPAEMIGWKDGNCKLLVDCESFKAVKDLAGLNPSAGSVHDLYEDFNCNRVWHKVVVSPDRRSRRELLCKHFGSDHLAKSFSLSSHSSSSLRSNSDAGSSSFSSQPSFGSFSSISEKDQLAEDQNPPSPALV